ncbi:hypothetical protein A15D_00083 [Alcanivorax sp. MD8A]|uniref:DUF4062 domain-containing protein n=1 Tax=Alcanivorax sp. MD8A TaxID=1177157 RepID=UPI000CBC57E4|nr:DUF4062 domain-containing protein [Alcanivorax sp. MD8A]PNE04304.1 hypothetical protein A15D_00083 [Alcanivorax sp. MD8A]
MSASKRYQVFISATYPDMQGARQALMLPMIEHGMIPTGLDSAAADGNTLLPVIQKLIETSDYFILVVGGRYGHLSPMGLSEIHREYIFAATKRKPIVAFIHDNPDMLEADQREATRDGQVRRDDFVRLLEEKVPSFRWTTEANLAELAHKVIPNLMREHRTPGWVRADQTGLGGGAEAESLKARISELEKEREESLAQSRPALKTLARGGDQVALDYSCNVYEGGDCKLAMVTTRISWDQAFSCVAPLMLNPASEPVMQKALEDFIVRKALADVQTDFPRAHAVRNVVLAAHSFNQLKIHLRALGLISKAQETDNRGLPLWQLTAHGDNTMSQVMAVKRSVKL